jgi:broad specificity phosphatase PhoE
MRLIIIRHGQAGARLRGCITLAQHQQAITAYDAAHLSDNGVRSIRSLVAQLPEAPILSSDLLRARETAEIIGGGRATIRLDSVFRELQEPTLVAPALKRVRLPPALWSVLHWVCWLVDIGKCIEGPRAAWKRARQATGLILSLFNEEDTLILVSHGWFITLITIYLRQQRLIEHGPLLPQAWSFGGMTEYDVRVV